MNLTSTFHNPFTQTFAGTPHPCAPTSAPREMGREVWSCSKGDWGKGRPAYLGDPHRREQLPPPPWPAWLGYRRSSAGRDGALTADSPVPSRHQGLEPGVQSFPWVAARDNAGGQLPLLSCPASWEPWSLSKEWICAAQTPQGLGIVDLSACISAPGFTLCWKGSSSHTGIQMGSSSSSQPHCFRPRAVCGSGQRPVLGVVGRVTGVRNPAPARGGCSLAWRRVGICSSKNEVLPGLASVMLMWW